MLKILHRVPLAAVLAFSIVGYGAARADITEKLRPNGGPSPMDHALAECRLPEAGAPIAALSVGGQTPRIYEMPSQYAMVVLDLLAPPPRDSGFYKVRKLPLLPDGGIWEPDLCGPMETVFMRIPADGKRMGTATLRLRPSLDLAAKYPAFGAKLAASGRVVRTTPKRFAAFRTFPNDEQILREALADHPLVQSDKTMWTMPGYIFVPLKPAT